MSKIAVKGAETGTGVFTIESPATNTDRTLTLPDEAGTILTSGGAIDVDSGAPADSLVVDSSGNVLVGKTSANSAVQGGQLNADGVVIGAVTSKSAALFNRLATDGSIIGIRKDGTTVGSIGVVASADLYIAEDNNVGLVFNGGGSNIKPCTSDGSNRDNAIDLGASSVRFDDIYATNGTIQTSDEREKENIASLTPAEMAVGKRLSSLFKTFTWVDKVRTHSGIIAQDVKAAFEAEGLDAGNYALFIHTEWTDEETGEQRDRMGVRYPELLSFVAAYNDQRFAAIEARLDALEGI
jgi:hypothetical protein